MADRELALDPITRRPAPDVYFSMDPRAGASSMNLSDASVDLTGQLIAAGEIAFAADPAGHFTPSPHASVRVSARAASIRLVGAKTWRDSSGFMVVEEITPVVRVPEPLSLIIRRALAQQPAGPVRATLSSQDGWLESAGRLQALSDWTLEVAEDGDILKIAISAALRAIDPIPPVFAQSRGNFWTTAGEEAPRVKTHVAVNRATRIAMFGTHFIGFPEDELSDMPPTMATASLRLADAPVGLTGEIYGYGSDGRWIRIFDSDSDSGIALDRHRPPRRYANGFLAHPGDPQWPRIWLSRLDMTKLEATTEGETTRLELQGGSLQWSDEMSTIDHARIDYRLTDCGLELSYHAEGPVPQGQADQRERIFGQLTIPWEILILRYPGLAGANPGAAKHRTRPA